MSQRDSGCTWAFSPRKRRLNDHLSRMSIRSNTRGSPESVLRAAELGLPMFLWILSGTPEHWAQYGRAYRHAGQTPVIRSLAPISP
jgi:hypothetical protein